MTSTAPAAPRCYSVRAHVSRGGDAQLHAGGHTVALDAGWTGPPTGAPGPADLLAGALAACILKNLERAGELLDFDYEDATVEVTATRRDAPPSFTGFSYVLAVATDEPERRLDLLHRNLTKFGTVHNTLAAAAPVHGRVVAVPLAGATPPL